ncbi:MAG: AI-2E family transporter [Sphingomonadales bacterium]
MRKPSFDISRHRLFIERLFILAIFAGGVILLWRMSDLLILVFGAIVIGLLLRVIAEPIARWTGFGPRISLMLSVASIVLLSGMLVGFFGAQIRMQFSDLVSRLPQAWIDFENLLSRYPFGSHLLDALRQSTPAGPTVVGRLSDLLLTVGSGLADLLLLAIGAIFFAAQPDVYRGGFLKLFPAESRPLVGEVLDDCGGALRLWLRGQLFSMIVVGLLTWAGLALAGVPSAFALGAIAAIAEVIPYVGPIVSAVPGLLLALLVSPETVGWAFLVYLVVQQTEGNLIQPLVQKHVVTLPPAVTLFAMVAAGLLFGFIGLVFAAPASVVAYVLIKRLWVRELLHTATSVPGEELGASVPTSPPASRSSSRAGTARRPQGRRGN